jgi:hypothetical protein
MTNKPIHQQSLSVDLDGMTAYPLMIIKYDGYAAVADSDHIENRLCSELNLCLGH